MVSGIRWWAEPLGLPVGSTVGGAGHIIYIRVRLHAIGRAGLAAADVPGLIGVGLLNERYHQGRRDGGAGTVLQLSPPLTEVRKVSWYITCVVVRISRVPVEGFNQRA